jgi:uncharacterized damage-inducible protein DinB
MGSLFPAPDAKLDTEKDFWLDLAEREHATTVRMLEAYPADGIDLQPTPKSPVARDLLMMMVKEWGGIIAALTSGFDPSKPPPQMKPLETLEQIRAAQKETHAKAMELVRKASPEDLTFKTVKFATGPGPKIGDVRVMDVLWMLLRDQIHHRGQLTVYSRLAGGTVPSIYGPSADEPWR